MRLLPLLLLCSSCISDAPAIKDARNAIRDVGRELEQLRSLIEAVCSSEAAPAQCDEMVRRFNALQEGYTVINELAP